MSWRNNRLSFSHLSWWRNCKRAFNKSMSSDPQVLNKIIKLGAEFGNLHEEFWDKVFEEDWFSKTRDEVEELSQEELLNYKTDVALKIRDGFWPCFEQLQEILEGGYELELQKKLLLPTPPFESYGKLDYFVIRKRDDQPIIIDAKGSSARNKKYAHQMLHYSWMYWKMEDRIPLTYIYYGRKGWVDDKSFNQSQLERYEKLVLREIEEIAELRSLVRKKESAYRATVSNDCFVCGYWTDCQVKKAHDMRKKEAFILDNQLNEDELLM